MTITVYTRRGCHLCAEAERVVEEVARGRAEVQLVDIDAHPSLRDRYTVRVPVIAIDGVEVAEFEVSPDQLRAEIDRRAA